MTPPAPHDRDDSLDRPCPGPDGLPAGRPAGRRRTRRRLTPALLATFLLTALAGTLGLVGTSPAAQAIICPPGFETLPGCTNTGGGGDGGDDGTAATGTWTTETVAGMSVSLYVPETAPAHPDGRALMVTLHGCVQKAADLKNGGNWAATADEYGMVVAVPAAPNGGVLLGCWDYYDANHSRTSPARHDDNLLGLASALTSRPGLGVDADQVYLSGLSSGGGQTMVMGCLAPDVFAGIGINAGPTVGTTSGQISSVATSKTQGTSTCRSFAGSAASSFDTQLTSVVYGSNDSVVAPGYNPLNAEIMAGLYGASSTSSFSLAGLDGTNTAGTGTLYSDADGPRVSLVQNTGLGHNWPAGGGPGGSYISTNSIDYPAYVTEFFFENNRRTGPLPTGEPTPTDEPTPTEDPTPTEEPEPTEEPTTAPEQCVTAANADHRSAGRATSYGVHPYNPYYAVGSQDYLGQGDATVTSLHESADGVFDLVPAC
ncbi:MAG: depolymerase family esterase [Citricoccus sp.]|nr:depolymerase family esterase [Citricoccus sp. WCRC_4]